MTSPTRITAAEYLARLKTAPRKKEGRVKGVRKATFMGIKFDSKWECDRYKELYAAQQRGRIANLDRQVKIPLMGQDGPIVGENDRQRVYIADMVYDDLGTGERVIEDAKGFRDPLFILKKAILRAQGISIREVRRDGK